jgi:hypothetical protein
MASTSPAGAARERRLPSFMRQIGPGIVTGAADDDPSGIATYTQAGAQFGTSVLWTVFLSIPCMVAIQLVSARIGRQSGKGIVANLRAHLPRAVVLLLVGLLLVANTINIAADIGAMAKRCTWWWAAASTSMRWCSASAPCAAGARAVPALAPILKWLTLSLFVYVAAAFTIDIPWARCCTTSSCRSRARARRSG